jgi:tetratricopeptide (TPR) repeat protein/predicted aspartyl protease
VRVRHLAGIAALAAFSLSSAAAGRCQLQQFGVLPVDMQGTRPLVSTTINGVKARFLLDSGAFYSTMSRDAAAQYQLPISPVPRGDFYITGTGGEEKAQIATVESFGFLGVNLPKVQFLVVDQNMWGDSAGSIGQNLLRVTDVEYDLANGLVRFIKPVGCGDQPLAYWAVSTPFSLVELHYMDAASSHLLSTAEIDGHRIKVLFDTGAPRSILSKEAAERVGITTNSPGVTFLGVTSGIGNGPVRMWSAPVDTFQIGDEKIEHTHLLIGDLPPQRGFEDWDMLLGEDFFISHRIYVAYSQRKLYFTYNGGPVFNLNAPPAFSGAAKPAAVAGSGQPASASTGEQPISDAPTDADGFRRRGMAYASRREFDLALADLTRACELAPRDADAHYDRGLIYAQEHQIKSALKDFNTAMALAPDDIDAHLARAELLRSQPDADSAATRAEIESDLDAVRRLAAPVSNLRLALADLYSRVGNYDAGIDQVDQWLEYHPLENDQAVGLNERCWLRAIANRDLHEALDDCNRALALRPDSPQTSASRIRTPMESWSDPDFLDSRGLVYLRLGRTKDAIRDYDSALERNSTMSTSLYGRGLAELRLGEQTKGQADLAAAQKLDSGVAKLFAGMGLAPR